MPGAVNPKVLFVAHTTENKEVQIGADSLFGKEVPWGDQKGWLQSKGVWDDQKS